MASKRKLKRNLNNVMGDVIELVYIHQMANPEADEKKCEAIVDETIAAFDELNAKINDRTVENRGAHLKKTDQEIEAKVKELIVKLDKA